MGCHDLGGVAQGQLGHYIIETHVHTQCFCQNTGLAADRSVPNQAQGLAADFIGADG